MRPSFGSGEPRAKDDASFAARGAKPGAGARDVLERAVHERNARFGKGLAEARFQLRSEADLRNQYQRLLAALQNARDAREVDLGLSAAGHAMKQVSRKPPEPGANFFDASRLVRRQRVLRDEARRAGVACLERLARQRLHRAKPRRQ